MAMLSLGAPLHGAAPPEAERLVVVYNSNVLAYVEALEGIREELGAPPILMNLKDIGAAVLAEALRRNAGKLIIAVGREAVRALANLKAALVITTMGMHTELGGDAAAGLDKVGEVHLDVELLSVLKELRRMYPSKNRLGAISNPACPEQEKGKLGLRARQQGYVAEVAECSGAGNLLPAFMSLKNKTDFVLCFADGSLYNSATVEPLILASLKERIPIIGFSESFVRAGAAFGIFPDFRDIGRQTAEYATRQLAGGREHSEEGPRKLKTAANRRVLRLLGLERPASVTTMVDR